MTRCRNCGDARHATQECVDYGPWYPEPGKTRADYAKEEERISGLVAVDIIHEHELDHMNEHGEGGGIPPQEVSRPNHGPVSLLSDPAGEVSPQGVPVQ